MSCHSHLSFLDLRIGNFRCQRRQHGTALSFHPTWYGNDRDGYRLYAENYHVDVTRGSGVVYFENALVELYFQAYSHGWLSQQAMAPLFEIVFCK